MTADLDKHAGLADVVAAVSSICTVDGERGILRYCGIDIVDLAAQSTFEETLFLLWYGRLPTSSELEHLKAELAMNRDVPTPVLALLAELPRTATPMETLRTALSLLSLYDPDDADMSREANVRKAVRLVSQTPTLIASIQAIGQGLVPPQPRQDGSLAANFLSMLLGSQQSELAVHALDVAFILHADHELNASTFAARVTAATLADIYSAVVSAVSTLKGPLHGGANEEVYNMLHAIAEPAHARTYIADRLERGMKIPGFGHRVYHTIDPRARVLKDLSKRLAAHHQDMRWYDMSLLVEDEVFLRKKLFANVDFYSASTYAALDLPSSLFTPIFAASRMAGWTAHILEQYGHNRLIRPRADYIGPAAVAYVPMSARN